MTNESKLLDEGGAAELLGCSVAALRRWRLLGKGPSYCKLGRLVRYMSSDLAAFLNANRVETVGGAQ